MTLAIHPDNLGAEQGIEKEVAVPLAARGLVAIQHERTAEAMARAGGGRLTRMVGLVGAGGEYVVGARCQRRSEREFQLSRLVAAGSEAGRVVAFDEQTRTGRAEHLP